MASGAAGWLGDPPSSSSSASSFEPLVEGLRVRNTFLEYQDPDRARRSALRRVRSDSSRVGGGGDSKSTSTSSLDQSVRHFALADRGIGRPPRGGEADSCSSGNSHLSSLLGERVQIERPEDSREDGCLNPADSADPKTDSAQYAELLEEFERHIIEGTIPGRKVEQLRKLLPTVPKDPATGKYTSTGSIGHNAGNCQNCVFWFKGECNKGVACNFCHYSHDGQKVKRIRPSKQTRDAKAAETRKISEAAGPLKVELAQPSAAPDGEAAAGSPTGSTKLSL